MDRRTFLATAGLAVGGAAGLGGCLESTGSGPATDPDTPDPATATQTDTAGGDGTPVDDTPMDDTATPTFEGGPAFAEHPATQGIRKQPYLGPEPASATGTIVAFEDPSCPRCKAFEEQTRPQIESELVEPGDATFVFRGYPVVYAWGKPATQALEATFARDEDAHWSLLSFYFRQQDQFDRDNVLDRTEQFLSGQSGVDAAAVVEDAREKAFDDAVQLDLTAGDEGGANSITPSLVLFRDGEYQTTARGSVSFSLVKAALGL